MHVEHFGSVQLRPRNGGAVSFFPSDSHGIGFKSPDVSAGFGCAKCHDALDGRRAGLSREDKEFYMRRSQTRTLLRLIERGIVRIEQ